MKTKFCVTGVIAVVLLSALMAFVLSGVGIVPFHGDEAIYIRMSRDYDYLIRDGDLKRLLYTPKPSDGRQEQFIRVTIGSIHPFAIGLARHLLGMGEKTNKFWLWDDSPENAEEVWQRNLLRGSYPDPAVLRIGRFVSAIFGACALILFFIAAQELTKSRMAATAACLLLATSPLFLVHVRRAMQEGVKMFFLCLCFYVAVRVARSFPGLCKKEYVLLGITTGLTLAAKQDAAIAIVAIYAAILFSPLFAKKRLALFLVQLRYTAAATSIALAVFLALMPVFWNWWASIVVLLCIASILFFIEPGNNKLRTLVPVGILLVLTLLFPATWNRFADPFQILFMARERVVTAQIRYRERNSLPVLRSSQQRALFLGHTIFSSAAIDAHGPRMLVAARAAEMRAYQASFLSGRHHLIVLDAIIGCLFLSGVFALIRTWSPASLLACSLFAGTALILFLTVPLAFDRYYLILQIPYCLISAVGIQQVRDAMRKDRTL